MKIGILQPGYVPTELVAEFGEYTDMFAAYLAGDGFEFDYWDVQAGQIPGAPDLADGWLIAGSRHGVYEDHNWLPPLEAFVRAAYAAAVPMVGICFGHQVIAKALGGHVEKFKGGWVIGCQTYQAPTGDKTLFAWHQDQVITPPEGAQVLFGNEMCKNAALLYDDRAFTMQPHPEFGPGYVAGLIEYRAKGNLPDAQVAQARQDLDAPIDQAQIARQIKTFFREKRIA